MKRIAIIFPWAVSLLAVILVQPGQAQVRGKALFDLMSNEVLVETQGVFRVNWLPDGTGYYVSEKDTATNQRHFYRVDPKSRKKTPLFDAQTREHLIQSYAKVSGRKRKRLPFRRLHYVLDSRAIKFSGGNKDFLYNFDKKELRHLKHPEVKRQPGTDGLMRNMPGSQLWNGEYSPDYSQFAYVKDYDLYVANTTTGEAKRVTFGGNANLLHGRPDWVYPEEFEQLTAYWWSPDGSKLAYYEFDESAVFQYPIVNDLKAEAVLELQNYPTAGETNPTVKLFIVDVKTGDTVEIQTDSNSDTYIVKPKWLLDGSELTFQRLNRRQNVLELLAANPETGAVRTILKEDEEAFVNLHDDFILLKDGKRFLWSSERSGWRHLYLYDLQGRLLKQLTKGEWPVGRIVNVDEKGKWVYFTAYTANGLESHFFRVKLDGSKFKQLTTEPGNHRISMDPAGKYYTDSYSSFTTPSTMNIHRADGKMLHNLRSSDTSKLDSLALEPPELVVVQAADGKTDLHGLLFKPAGFDSTKSYPLLISVYGGPHSKMVFNRFQKHGYLQRLAQLGFMVWTMDNRGLQFRGKQFETATYLRLGQVDLADQVAGVRQISRRPYIDGSRVGIFGGSYGGYMTCIALLKEPEVFHVGVAGSSVTDWRNYDTIYTERYMRTPQENPEGYDTGSALKYAANLKGKLLLIHGTIDNNVHPGNTIQLVDALIKAGKRFDLMLYPGYRHGIYGEAGKHYRQLMIDYFVKHLQPEN